MELSRLQQVTQFNQQTLKSSGAQVDLWPTNLPSGREGLGDEALHDKTLLRVSTVSESQRGYLPKEKVVNCSVKHRSIWWNLYSRVEQKHN